MIHSFERKIPFYYLAYLLKLGLVWLYALAAKICLKLLDWKNHSIPMIKGNLEARSRRKDCQGPLRMKTGRQTWKEGPLSSTLLATLWFGTASKHLGSSAYRVTGAGTRKSHECPQVNRWLVKTHLDGCSGQRVWAENEQLIFILNSCRMGKKFQSNSCVSDPRLQRLR